MGRIPFRVLGEKPFWSRCEREGEKCGGINTHHLMQHLQIRDQGYDLVPPTDLQPLC